MTTVDDKGEVTFEGQFVGRLDGFRFFPDASAAPEASKAIRSASAQALEPELILRSQKMSNAPDNELGFTEQGGLMWGDVAVGKLVAGDDALTPRIEAFVGEEADAEVKRKVERRLKVYVDRQISSNFEHLLALKNDSEITGISRGFAFRLIENFGIVNRWSVTEDAKALDQDARKPLRKHGVRFGQYSVYLHPLLKPAPTRLRVLLWSLSKGLQEFPPPPPPSLVTIPKLNYAPEGYYPICGFHRAGDLAIRIDMLERLADLLRSEDSVAGFEATSDMLSIAGLNVEHFAVLMRGLGFNAVSGIRRKTKPVKSEIADKPKEGSGTRPAEEAAEASIEISEAETVKEVSEQNCDGDKRHEETLATARKASDEDIAIVGRAEGQEIENGEAASGIAEAAGLEAADKIDFEPAIDGGKGAYLHSGEQAAAADGGEQAAAADGGEQAAAADGEEEEVVFYTFTRVARRKRPIRGEERKIVRKQADSRESPSPAKAELGSRGKSSEQRPQFKPAKFERREPRKRKHEEATPKIFKKPRQPKVEIDPDNPFAALIALKKKL